MTRPDLVSTARRLLDDHRIRYVLVGGGVACLYLTSFASLSLLLRGWGYLTWFALAQAITMAVAFPLYRTWVFESRGTVGADLARFTSVWGASLVGSLLSLPVLVEGVGMRPVIAQGIAVPGLALASYLGHRFVSFQHR